MKRYRTGDKNFNNWRYYGTKQEAILNTPMGGFILDEKAKVGAVDFWAVSTDWKHDRQIVVLGRKT
jgi:hypothetical protein